MLTNQEFVLPGINKVILNLNHQWHQYVLPFRCRQFVEMVNGTDSEVRCLTIRSPKSQDSYPGSPSLSPRHGASNTHLHTGGTHAEQHTDNKVFHATMCWFLPAKLIHEMHIFVAPSTQEQTALPAVMVSPLPTSQRATAPLAAAVSNIPVRPPPPPPPPPPPLPLSTTPSPTPLIPPRASRTAPTAPRKPGERVRRYGASRIICIWLLLLVSDDIRQHDYT